MVVVWNKLIKFYKIVYYIEIKYERQDKSLLKRFEKIIKICQNNSYQ